MKLIPTTPTLAVWSDYIGFIIVAAILIFSWLGNLAKASPKSQSGGGGGLGQRRQQMNAGSARSTSDEPANLSMAERIARVRAKAQYEARARQLQQQPASRPASAAPDTPGSQSADIQRQGAEHARQQAQEIRSQRSHARQQEITGQRQRARTRQQEIADQRQQARTRQQEIADQRRRPAAARTRAVSQVRAVQQPATHHRHISLRGQLALQKQQISAPVRNDLATPAPTMYRAMVAPGSSLRRVLRSPGAMRSAFILKELLDKPVGLRDPFDSRAY